jgi:hypothetical protein
VRDGSYGGVLVPRGWFLVLVLIVASGGRRGGLLVPVLIVAVAGGIVIFFVTRFILFVNLLVGLLLAGAGGRLFIDPLASADVGLRGGRGELTSRG